MFEVDESKVNAIEFCVILNIVVISRSYSMVDEGTL